MRAAHGSKAKNLLILRENGISVPGFVVVGDKDIKESDLNDILSSSLLADKGTVSIRSSSSLEDAKTLSFAGQFKTFLNVPKGEVFSKMKKCFNATSSESLQTYLDKMDMTGRSVKMSVIIQEMIDSDYSGVIFTANPQGILNETVITIGRGTGDKVVEDKTPTSTYYYNLDDRLYYSETQIGAPTIATKMVDSLVNLSSGIKDIFGREMDIEFAIKDDMIYILQARPITTLTSRIVSILDNSNLVESYPNITLPLSASFVKSAYTGVMRGLLFRLTGKQENSSTIEKTLKNMVVSYNGRMYYKIDNWYYIINLLPFSKKIIPIWEKSLGLSSARSSAANISLWTKLKVASNVLKLAFTTPRQMQQLEDTFFEAEKYFKETYSESMPNKDLLKLYRELGAKIFPKWDITLANDMYAFIHTGIISRKAPHKVEAYISDVANIASIEPLIKLKEIVQYIQENSFEKELAGLRTDKDARYFLAMEGDLQVMLNNYISCYGDRYLEELKLESSTYRTDPILLIRQIEEYTKLGALEKIGHARKVNLPNNRRLRKEIERARLGIRNREISRLNRTRIYGMVRTIFLSIARNLRLGGDIKTERDIFYLTMDEVTNLVSGSLSNAQDLISNRKRQYAYFETLPQYHRLVFSGQITDKESPTAKTNVVDDTEGMDQKHFVGTPCSLGIVEGEAIVITNPSDNLDTTGKILIAKSTDPGWVFLMANAKGIIAEQGSLLSHTAIVSRELRIPSVVGIPHITKVVKTGDRIRMNGRTGKIEVLDV